MGIRTAWNLEFHNVFKNNKIGKLFSYSKISISKINIMIDKGWILQMEEGGKRAKIKTSEGEILDKVLMLYP